MKPHDQQYNPVPRVRRKAPTSSFASLPIPLLRKGAHDDDDALASARYELERLDGRFAEAARAVDKMSKARKTLAAAEGDLGGKLVLVATTEVVPTLGVAMRKLGRAMDAASGIQTSQVSQECCMSGVLTRRDDLTCLSLSLLSPKVRQRVRRRRRYVGIPEPQRACSQGDPSSADPDC